MFKYEETAKRMSGSRSTSKVKREEHFIFSMHDSIRTTYFTTNVINGFSSFTKQNKMSGGRETGNKYPTRALSLTLNVQ